MDAQVLNFKRYDSGALTGFFDLEVHGITFIGCKCFVKGNSVWFAFPAIKSTDASGEVRYTPTVTATTTTMREIQDAVRPQLRAALESNAGAPQKHRTASTKPRFAGTAFRTPEGENLDQYRSTPNENIPF
jgi:hypothetical protein